MTCGSAKWLRLRVLAATLLTACVIPAPALEPSTQLAGYARQAWVMENGLPQNTVQALLQTRDGFIWLGTEAGLVRFDGTTFQVFDRNTAPALPGNDVQALLETPDGALWIGTADGLARWKDGARASFTTKDGLPGNRIEYLNPDGHGGVLVNRAYALENGSWKRVSSQQTVLQDGSRPEFQIHLDGNRSAEASRDHVELDFAGKLTRTLTVGKELPGSKIQILFADREGGLWVGTNGGLARMYDGNVQRFPVTDTLATASITAVTEDREGDLWVGTEADGLHILRDQRFRTMTVRDGLTSDATTTVVEDAAGTLWVGTNGSGLNAISKGTQGIGRGSVRSFTVRDGLASDLILSLAAAPNGDLWAGTPDGLNRIKGGAVTQFTTADGLPDDFIRSLLIDRDGSLWIGTRRGLTHWNFKTDSSAAKGAGAIGRVETFTHASGLGNDLVGAMTRDAAGDLWIATFAGLSRMHDGKIENYTTANGLSSNVITSLLARKGKTILIGTQDHGWNVWDGKRFTDARSSNPADRVFSQSSIHAILEDQSGHVWSATANGIARGQCPRPDADSPANASVICMNWIEFGTADGLRSRETATNSHPSAWRSSDGHLWFATPKGLVEVDPVHFAVNNVPPPVALERFAIDDANEPLHSSDAAVHIPAGHVHFEFNYAALSFVAPQKVRYRYMLENFDHQWIDAGTRRTAYYTNIPAGRYIFRVQAANNDGVWNDQGAALAFELRPHFYQTFWFYALLLALAIGIVVLVQRIRLARAQREFNAVLGERNRIAREIHDTLAQGYVGISVQLELLAELLRLNKPDTAARQLDVTRGYVREGLADARQSIWALRSQDAGETTLPVKLRRMVEAANDDQLNSQLSIFGAYRPLDADTEREVLRVAQEAIHNVKKHSRAKDLAVHLEYKPNEVALDLKDDGRGFAVSDAQKPGHFGLIGMRERAAAIGATIDIAGEPGAGTTVRLRLKSRKPTEEQERKRS